jgi:UDP-2,3-diacylglucosamine hydrolase
VRNVNDQALLALSSVCRVYSDAVSDQTVYVFGDAHLGEADEGVATALRQFLDVVPVSGDHVVINGDLFDFWFEYGTVIPRSAFRTLTCLANVRARGVQLTVTGGNHDRWGRGFWEREMDATFHPGNAVVTLAGWRAYLAHGDEIEDVRLSARLLHTVTRHPLTATMFRWVHPDLGYRWVRRFAGARGERNRDRATLERAAAVQLAWASSFLERRPEMDLVILGHTHRAALLAVGPRRWYLNPGAWMDGLRYAVIDASGPELRSYRFK